MMTWNDRQKRQWAREKRGLAAGHTRIDKKLWQAMGGFSNPDLFRKADSRGYWTYWRI